MSISPENFSTVRDAVRMRVGVELGEHQDYLVEARLTPLLDRQGVSSFSDLLAPLQAAEDTPLTGPIVDALLPRDTSFFRDGLSFETLVLSVLPLVLSKKSATRMISIWCAGVSSGQEAFSLAMLIDENSALFRDYQIRIIGSEVSSQALGQAQRGHYSQIEINRGINARRRSAYFEERDDHWQIKAEIRNMVEFRNMNLAKPWCHLPPMDIVFLRNVLTYLSDDAQSALADKMKNLLRAGSCLILGNAETLLQIGDQSINDAFETRREGSLNWYERKGEMSR